MALEIGAIERSRRVDSQAWCFFFSTRKIRDAGVARSQVITQKSLIFRAWDKEREAFLEYAVHRLFEGHWRVGVQVVSS